MYSPLDETQLGGLPLWKVVLGVFVPSLAVFVGLDIAWIALVAKDSFQQVLGDLMRAQPGILAGVLAWVAIVGGLLHFVGARATSKLQALLHGLILGLVIYASYELTNLSIISTWGWGLAAADTLWGGFDCAICALTQQMLIMWWRL